ncbi:MAG TPA: dihydrofolate reductase family protein [Pyrinomonadaceae bacterium]|jgi:dihydrofolate reductase
MRKVTFGGANSVDNFFARKDDAVDWLKWSPEVAEISNEYWKTIDTVLMGRRTFEVAKSAYPGVKNYVCSRTLKHDPAENVELVSGDAADFVRELKNQPGKGICVIGGGLLAKSLLEVGLIDELGMNIQPVLLGSGIPLFHQMEKQIDLELLESKVLKNGCVYVLYRVLHDVAQS